MKGERRPVNPDPSGKSGLEDPIAALAASDQPPRFPHSRYEERMTLYLAALVVGGLCK